MLAFPSNDFHQETGTDEEILEYVNEHFPEVHFPIFSKSPLSSNMVFQVGHFISFVFLAAMNHVVSTLIKTALS